MEFGDRVRYLRKACGLSQEELAERLDLTRPSVTSWETGKTKPRLDKLEQLASILGTSAYYLLNGEEPPSPDFSYPSGARRPVGRSGTVPMRRLGKTHAGSAVEEMEDEGTVEVPARVTEMHPNGFALSVEGDCMDRAYPDGCVVLVDPDAQPWNGCAVVAETSPGESVLRRYMRGSNTLMLSADSHSGDYEDMVFSNEETQEVRTLGVVVWFQADHDEYERW
ncbi:MAG TPA: XRE family transcriptional regulator [Candidatus Olsenella pullistercoris]|uniref:XRE family transcriptional regulator n=1 Tax=Candidatus Olsenella pullistercoris TaxID=2838712 RepID=A0A9D2JFQ9_9ACTN|nr:XRE family transcriptional regulator [Candidatus Olsenella pullistercoris]